MRLDAYLAQYWPEHSRSTWQKYIEAGYVLVNGEVEKLAKRLLDEDDEVTTNVPAAPTHDDATLPVVYQDENVIVINKPIGVLTHSKGALNDEFTVADFFRRFSTYHLETNRPGIVHRLDRDTSGLMLAAKNDETGYALMSDIRDRAVDRRYLALVHGVIAHDTGMIDAPIARAEKELEAVTKQFIDQIDESLKHKEAELLEV